jgi:hypothetical protein
VSLFIRIWRMSGWNAMNVSRVDHVREDHNESFLKHPMNKSPASYPFFLLFVLALSLGPSRAQAEDASLLTTFSNPTPADSAYFGGAVAAMGSDRVLVGAQGASEAYLFSLNGTLLTTFTVSEPLVFQFGAAIAAVGSDRVLIGAFDSYSGEPLGQVGWAGLFDTNGVLQSTFTNPAPATTQAFGWAVAALGSDRVIISGVPDINKRAPYPGCVYLFRTNGTLLTSFINPVPADPGRFGQTIAAVGSDRVLIGAPYNDTGAPGIGSAYLYSTNGALLTTFTNPVPTKYSRFGTSAAGVGSDRVLIGAIDDGGSMGTGGTAYLFNTNGTLLTTFTNPNPAHADNFGGSVAAVGRTRVLIGAYQDGTGGFQNGSAYLFSTNGTLLNTFTNPTPASQDWFAYSVAAVGSDHVLIGGAYDDTGAMDAGSAYLYELSYPPLTIATDGGSVLLNWVTPEAGIALQQTGRLDPANWSNATESVSVTGQTNRVQQSIVSTNRFFRLRRP